MSCKAAAAGSSSVVECVIYTKVQIHIDICVYIHRLITYFLIDYKISCKKVEAYEYYGTFQDHGSNKSHRPN